MSWHYEKCPECGATMLMRDDNPRPCNKCANLRKRYSRAAQFRLIDPDSLTIEYDPISFYDGGFRKGATITKIQAECMCDAGTFSDGTILVDKNNNKFHVLRTYNGKQQLMRL